MRIVAASDFHYPRRVTTLDPVHRMASSGADVLVFAGDMVDTFDPVNLLTLLQAAADFTGPRLYVWGNHELWSVKTPAQKLHAEALPALAREAGFHPLEIDGPLVHQGTAFVGAMGWYDYAFAEPDVPGAQTAELVDARLEDRKLKVTRTGRTLSSMTTEDYAKKSVSWYEHKRLRTATWGDGEKARWEDLTDFDLVERGLQTLRAQLDEVHDSVERVVVVMHMVPHADGLHVATDFFRAWLRAYMGSPRVASLLENYPKVRHVLFGHCHRGRSFEQPSWSGHNLAAPHGEPTYIEVQSRRDGPLGSGNEVG